MQKGGSEEYLHYLDQHRRQPPPQMPNLPRAENHHQPPPSQKCPRCDSSNTKFCYYNNYSLSQPRYFCKACRRYWTHGGTLRNVPIGGGCRKSKPSKPSSSSSSNSGTARRIRSLSPPLPFQNSTGTGMISGQSLRTWPPANTPQLGNISFYSGGAFLPSLAAMQPLPTGVDRDTAPVSFGGSGSGHFSGNMTLIQGTELSPPLPQQIQSQNGLFPSQLILQRPLSSWTQTSVNRGITSSSATSSSFWCGAATGGNSTNGRVQLGSSLNPSQWSDNHPGYDPCNQ